MEEKKYACLEEFFCGDDKYFYEKFLVNLTPEELERFLVDNPDFPKEIISKK